MSWGVAFRFESKNRARRAFERVLTHVHEKEGLKNVAVAFLEIDKQPHVVLAAPNKALTELIGEVGDLCGQGESVEIDQSVIIFVLAQHELEGISRGPGKYRRFQPKISNN